MEAAGGENAPPSTFQQNRVPFSLARRRPALSFSRLQQPILAGGGSPFSKKGAALRRLQAQAFDVFITKIHPEGQHLADLCWRQAPRQRARIGPPVIQDFRYLKRGENTVSPSGRGPDSTRWTPGRQQSRCPPAFVFEPSGMGLHLQPPPSPAALPREENPEGPPFPD